MDIDLGIDDDFCQGEEIHDFDFDASVTFQTLNNKWVTLKGKVRIASRLDISHLS